jgi:hypothetical protein
MVSHPQNKIPPISHDPQGLEFPRPQVCTGFTQTIWDDIDENNVTTAWDNGLTLWDETDQCPPQPGG